MSEPAPDWPETGEAAQAMRDYMGPAEPQADSLDATLAAVQRLLDRTMAGTNCDVASYSMPAMDGTLRIVRYRPKPPPPSAWKFWLW